MNQEGSTPDSQGGLDHSPNEQSAENVVQQPSTEVSQDQNQSTDESQGNDFFEESSNDAPSQATQNNTDDQDSNDSNSSNNESSIEPELKEWATKQGYSLNTQSEIAMAKRIRNSQQSFHEGKQNESKQKFNEAVESQDTGDYGDIQRKIARMEFFDAHPEARELEGTMYDIAVEALESGDQAGFNYYQTPRGWNALLRLAKAQAAETNQDDSYEAGRKDERTNLAKKQQASIATKSANDTKPTNGRVTDADVARMSQSEYNQFRRENPNWNPFA